MKKTLLILAVFVLGVWAIVLGSYVTYWTFYRVPVFLNTSSPRGTYSVSFNGRSDRGGFFINHSVWFNVQKNDVAIISQQHLHSGDWLDAAHYILYPQHVWESENALHLYREEYFTGGMPGTIVVKNNSNRAIGYMMVKAEDAHLLFDLKPRSRSTLTIPPSRGDHPWLYIEWCFEDEGIVRSTSETFVEDKQKAGVFFVNISDNRYSILSPNLKVSRR
jgi:hypothetical protein